MAKKFNFAQMEDTPIVQEATQTMVDAYTKSPVSEEKTATDIKIEESKPVEEVAEENPKTEQEEQIDPCEDIRQAWIRYQEKYPDGSFCKQMQLALPLEMHQRFEILKTRMEVPGKMKLVKKAIWLVALEEFLESHGV